MMAEGDGPKRRRAAKACVECHRRKVKCDVAVKGQPCSNCTADEVECQVVPRKRRAGRFSAPAPPDPAITTEMMKTNAPTPAMAVKYDSSESEDGRHAGALAAAIEDNPIANNAPSTIHYAGNPSGIVGFVADLVLDGNPSSAHYLVPHTARKALSAEELQYLRFKGVFSVPVKEACDELITLYFLHVHPLLPIIEASSFLSQYIEHGYSKVNLPLLWSMIFMAAGFVEPFTLSKMGYANRKALKRDAYNRAKVLYDTAYDDDQIALIQSVVLMSHWHADAEDRFEAWHWTNVAITLCQTAGLHQAPSKSTRQSPAFTEAREKLCRRIWWQCVVRDRWLSMVKGRPLRIHFEDCSVAPATAEDLEFDLRKLTEPMTSHYFPFDIKRISRLWAKQVHISVLLGDILASNARMKSLEPPQDQLNRLAEMEQIDWDIPQLEAAHQLERLCVYHVRLLFNAATIALWRPRILSTSRDATSDFRRQQAVERARAAAVSSNATLEDMISWDLVKFLKAQTITALVPAMQIHLLDCKSPITSIRMLGTNRLLLCMQLLTELKETYWAAEFALRLFQRAHEKVNARQKYKSEQPQQQGTPSSTTSNVPALEHNAMLPKLPYQEQHTPQSLSSDEEMLLAGFDWEGYPEMKPFWDDPNFQTDETALNTFFSANDFMTGLPLGMPNGT